ncbi:hypothetical protein LCGC14_0555070 [marine sediment metagenome]|uniref:Uncharacterized protein n=1 Tax=marine sediment metagenome TaxID=412755 RepID=A0A0F9UA52_9ZZZZ
MVRLAGAVATQPGRLRINCETSSACLACEMPECSLEIGRGERWLKKLRDKGMLRQAALGRNVRDLAAMFRVDVRTVQRVLKGART